MVKRRYTKDEKAGAVMAAVASSAVQAAEATGIPRRTIGYWMESEEFAEVRQKSQEAMAEKARVVSHVVLDRIMELLPAYKPAELNILYGILVDKGQLLSGEATARTETVALTAGLDDHEKIALRDAIDRILHPETFKA